MDLQKHPAQPNGKDVSNGCSRNQNKTTPSENEDVYCWTSMIQKSLHERKIYTRPNAGLGIWCAFLLPAAVIWSVWKTEVSVVYQVAFVVSHALLASSACFLWNLGRFRSHQDLSSGPFPVNLIIAGLTSAALVVVAQLDLMSSILFGFSTTFLFSMELLHLLQKCPGSFTLGEGCIAVQALFLFLITAVIDLVAAFRKTFWQETDYVNVIIEVGLLGILVLCRLPLSFPAFQQPIPFYCFFAFVMGGVVLPVLWILFEEFPFLWFLRFITTEKRMMLLGFWALCTLICIFLVMVQVSSGQHATTRIRKYFHFFLLAMYIPGILADYNSLYLASGVAFGIFCFMEAIRLLELPPLGPQVRQSLQLFVDEKDQGPLILTHTYLLVGCSTPLWLHPDPSSSQAFLPLISGLLAVGVGDAAASIGGSLFGRNKWPGTNKTLEGTFCSIISQGLTVALMCTLGWIAHTTTSSVLQVLFAIVVTSLVESLTDQVDNLVLPLIAYVILL